MGLSLVFFLQEPSAEGKALRCPFCNIERYMPKERRGRGVKKLISMVLTLAVLAAFTFGCASYVNKEQKVKCPKCGAIFTVDEGMRFLSP